MGNKLPKHLKEFPLSHTFARYLCILKPMIKATGNVYPLLIRVSVIVLLLLIFSPVFSQSKKNTLFSNTSVGIQGHYGSFLINKAKAEYIRDSYTSLAEIYFQKQTAGSRHWERSHKLPQWGFSYIYGNTGSRKYIGNLHAISAYITAPLIRKANYQMGFRLGAGPGWVNKPFDIHTNPKNTLIGTRLNAYILMMLQNEFRLSPRLSVNAGLSFIHVSNGGTSLPNLGLNTPAISAGLRYSFEKEIEAPDEKQRDSFNNKINYRLFTSIGVKQAPWIGGKHYLINVLQAEAARRFAANHVYGAGLILYYNRSLEFDPLETPADQKNKKRLQAGIYGFYEHFFGKLSIPLQAGAYIYNRDRFPFLFQQFGFKVQVSKHLNTGVLLKIHSGQADFIHTGIGYTF